MSQDEQRGDYTVTFLSGQANGTIPDLATTPWERLMAYLKEAKARGEKFVIVGWTHYWPD